MDIVLKGRKLKKVLEKDTVLLNGEVTSNAYNI